MSTDSVHREPKRVERSEHLPQLLIGIALVLIIAEAGRHVLGSSRPIPWFGYLVFASGAAPIARGARRLGVVLSCAALVGLAAFDLAGGRFPALLFFFPIPFAVLGGGMGLGTVALLSSWAVLIGSWVWTPVSATTAFELSLIPLSAWVLSWLVSKGLEHPSGESVSVQESQLIQMQKMEALGRMAGGIAHDFNNLLTVISGGVDLLARKGTQKELRLIESATNSARTLTSQLLTLSRQSVVEHEVCDLARNLAQMDRLLSRIIGEDILLKVNVEAHLHHVKLSETQLQQVLLNLVTNARDAMPNGGTLEIFAKNWGDEQVSLTVADTGVGMDDSTLQHVFEPFFTTKSVGKGTGLGLSMVFGLVNQSGGSISVESSPGVGTRFRLLLPRGEAESPASETSDQGVELWGRAQGTILLVEDDARVRSVCRSVLRREGYEVLDASEPLEAIELFRKHQSAIDLVITDLVMPNMTGIQLADVLRHDRPDLNLLFVSGYAPEDVLGRSLDARTLLRKPFRPSELLRRVSALLHGLDSQAPPPGSTGAPSLLPIPRQSELRSIPPQPVSGIVPTSEKEEELTLVRPSPQIRTKSDDM